MDIYTITEESYKNGYKNGYKSGYNNAVNKFAEEIKEEIWQMCLNEDMYALYPFSFVDKIVDRLNGDIK